MNAIPAAIVFLLFAWLLWNMNKEIKREVKQQKQEPEHDVTESFYD